MNFEYQDLASQEKELLRIILSSNSIKTILDNAHQLGVKNWYLGAGSIPQTVWNHLTNRPIEENISDYDLIYFDSKNISKESELKIQAKVDKLFSNLSTKVEVTNEARVHLWFKEDFGVDLVPYTSTEDAIYRWSTTASSIGITKTDKGEYKVFAPFGLTDIFKMNIKLNPEMVAKEAFLKKCEKWKSKWPSLNVYPM